MRLNRSYTFLAVAAVPLFIFLQQPRLSESLHAATISLLKPVLVFGDSVAGGFESVREDTAVFWKTFRDEREARKKITELESQVQEFDEIRRENERLKKLLEFRETVEGQNIAARIIGWDMSPWKKTVILDKGTGQGVRKDMAVISTEGLVGRVMEAGTGASRVLMLIDPDSRTSAVTSESRAQGVAAGDGSPLLKLTYLDLDSGIHVGETVMTSGVTGLSPKGIRIGVVESIAKSPEGLHLEAVVKPFVNFTKQEEVLCLDYSPQG